MMPDEVANKSERLQRFTLLLSLLEHVFRSGTVVSEDNYHDVVRCMRDYEEKGRAAASDEREMMNTLGWPEQYHPCDHMENIRFCLVFGSENLIVSRCVAEYWEHQHDDDTP